MKNNFRASTKILLTFLFIKGHRPKKKKTIDNWGLLSAQRASWRPLVQSWQQKHSQIQYSTLTVKVGTGSLKPKVWLSASATKRWCNEKLKHPYRVYLVLQNTWIQGNTSEGKNMCCTSPLNVQPKTNNLCFQINISVSNAKTIR